MGYEDTRLTLAIDETFSSAANGANSGNGGLGQQSVDLALEPGGTTEFFRNFDSMGNGYPICLSGIVGTSVTSAVNAATLEIQVVSIPFDANYLDDGAGGAGDGKVLTTSAMAAASNLVTFETGELQDISLGTPVQVTDAGTTGLVPENIYYVIPANRQSFFLATSLTNALNGVFEVFVGPTAVTLDWTPAMTIHASTGGIVLYNTGVLPTDQSALRADNRFEVPLRPLLGQTPDHRFANTYGAPTPATGFHKDRQPLGAGGGGPSAAGGTSIQSGVIGAHANQFYYLRYVPSDTITTGSLKKASLVLTGDSQLVYPGAGNYTKG